MGSRIAHVRELKTEIEKLKAENAELRAEHDSLKAHFDLALLAAMDLKDGEPLEIWDGWNLILGARKEAKDRADLIAQAMEKAFSEGKATADLARFMPNGKAMGTQAFADLLVSIIRTL